MNRDDNKKALGTRVIKDPRAVAAKHVADQQARAPNPPRVKPPSVPSRTEITDADATLIASEETGDLPTLNHGGRPVSGHSPQLPPNMSEAQFGLEQFKSFALEVERQPHLAQRVPGSTLRPPDNVKELSKLLPMLPALPLLRTRPDGAEPADLKLRETLGEGGMGVVLLGKQYPLSRDVAIKTVSSELDRESLQSLLHEAMVTGYLEHPNVIPIHAVGKDETGAPLIVMKRVEGVTWLDVIMDPLAAPNSGEVIIDLDWHLGVLMDICDALKFAHSREIAHRDIKPENVMLGQFGEVYLLDWGVAISYSKGEKPPFLFHTFESKGLAGTPAYMAPEMCENDPINVDCRSDIFLLGAVLHQLLTGLPPNGVGALAPTLVNAYICKDQVYPASVSAELAGIAQRAMAKRKEDRYSNVAEFREAILEYQEHRASITMSQEAGRRIQNIEPDVTRSLMGMQTPDINQQLIEARFALQQALAQWPGNVQAIKAKDRLACISFDYYMKTDNLGSAAGVISDMMPETALQYEPRLHEAQRVSGANRAEIAALRHELNPQIALQQRLILGVAIALLWAGLAAFKAWTRWGVPLEEVDPKYLISLVPSIGIPSVVILLAHKVFGQNHFNRRIFWYLIGGLVAVSLIRVGGWAYDAPAHITTGMEFIMYSLLAFVFGVLMNSKRAMAATSFLVIATLLAMAFPMYQYAFMAVAFLLFAPIIAWVWSTDRRI